MDKFFQQRIGPNCTRKGPDGPWHQHPVFRKYQDIPADRRKDVTYGRVVVNYRPQKEYLNRTRLTVGGDRIKYPWNVSTPTAALTTAKLVINSTISTPRARYMCCDLGNFYLGTPLYRYEYIRLSIKIFPQKHIDAYNLLGLVHNGYVYCEIQRCMYGLPQAGKLCYNQLVRQLEPHVYAPCRHTPGVWRHKWRPILFSLVVDDFGFKYVGRAHAEHLVTTLHKYHTLKTDWAGTLYCGIKLKWDYNCRTLDLSMPGYINAALIEYQHHEPRKPQHAPHIWDKPQYGQTKQYEKTVDNTPKLDAEGIKHIQKVIGTLLYYARAIDSTMLMVINAISAAQATGTTATASAVTWLLDYATIYHNATIRYNASQMILCIHSDASYQSESESRCRAGGYFFLGSNNHNDTSKKNGAICTTCEIIKNIMSAASEAECSATFIN